jgi:hypothetical protein
MTPSNPDNQQPLIYRIADALGVFHLVAPVNHTHAQSDVEGLESALAAKANASDVQTALEGKQNNLTFDATPTEGSTNPVTSGGVKTALDGKANVLHGHTSIQDEADAKSASVIASEDTVNIEVRNEEGGGECAIKPSNIGNLIRALSNPDTTPTANSTKLVTSGGVKAALDGKAPEGDTEVIFEEGENIFVHLPNYFSNGERQRSFILNYQGEQKELIELFGCSAHDMIRILSHDDSTIMVGECYIAVRVIKQPSGVEQGDVYYIIFDGRNDY